MSKAQSTFEAIMRSKGHSNFTKTSKGKYTMPSIQTRWLYFQLGWEMNGVSK